MYEKIIFEGRLDITLDDAQALIDRFLFDNLISSLDINLEVDKQGDKQIWVIKPSPGKKYPKAEITNGYVVMKPTLFSDQSVDIRIVSCRSELNLLYFQLSQQIQARAVIPDFPPEVLVTPWRKLVTQGVIFPRSTDVNDLLSGVPDPDETDRKYGTYRDLTANDVRRIIVQCNAYTISGGSVKDYYQTLGPNPRFALETLRTWIQNKKLNPSKS